MDLTTLFAAAIIFGLIGSAIGASKGRAGAGFLFGCLLGPIGWLLIAVGPNHSEKSTVPPAPMPSAAADSTTDRILDLKKLHDAGAITAAEYDEKKKALLERL